MRTKYAVADKAGEFIRRNRQGEGLYDTEREALQARIDHVARVGGRELDDYQIVELDEDE